MKTQKELIPEQLKSLAEAYLGDLSDMVFFDIETTGLSHKTAFVYLIGAAFMEGGSFVLHQYLAEDLSAEEVILKAFSERTKEKRRLLHFNGSTFDLPFLQVRCKKYGLACPASAMEQTDLYRRISPLKNVLKLPNCKLKTLEEFLGNHRKDPFTGGELIELYHVYRRERDERLLKVLLLHNAEDILGMLSILSMLAYPAISKAQALPQEAAISPCTDYAGKAQKELLLPVRFVLPLPQPLALNADGVFFSGNGLTGLLKVPVFCGELKHFYPDYRNYSYLPDEDCAIHKSVAIYVDKAHRIPARPETCYTRKAGEFLPLFLPGSSRESAPEETLFAPLFFRQSPAGKNSTQKKQPTKQSASFREGFFEAGSAFLKNSSLLSAYATHLLGRLLKA